MTEAYRILYTGVLVVLGLLVLLLLIRAARTPRNTDRIICINMISSMVIVMIAVLCVMLGEGYLMDAALLYAAMSFLAVVVFCRIWLSTGKRGRDASLPAEERKEEEDHV